eukprot:6003505-Pleurochrysis_carterae.AAC.1
MAKLGVLANTVYHQTGSGPDNDAKEAYALHCHLIHCGVVNTIVWLRLEPKHSHNLSDCCRGMVQEELRPHRGTGGECIAQWDSHGRD